MIPGSDDTRTQEVVARVLARHQPDLGTWECWCGEGCPPHTKGRPEFDRWHSQHVAEQIAEALGIEYDGAVALHHHGQCPNPNYNDPANECYCGRVNVYRIRALEAVPSVPEGAEE